MKISDGLLLLFILTAQFATEVHAQSTLNQSSYVSEKREFTATQILSNLENPWSIAFISNTDWLITEHNGQLRRVVDGILLDAPISGLPKIRSKGQGGLLDVALHPNFEKNHFVYLSYIQGENGLYGTEVLRGQLDGNALINTEVLFKAVPKVKGGRHFGSRLAFDGEGYLFISLGDRGSKETAQQLNSHLGAIVRLHDDGSIPPSNPFINVDKALPEIYSYGHRNVQGMVYDGKTNTLWAHEHGPQGGDELNIVYAGQNYGWPVITYGANYGTGSKIGEGQVKPGMLQPITYWDPSIAPSGLAVVSGPRFPQWQGNLLVGALKFQLIARLELSKNASGTLEFQSEERLLAGEFGRIRDVRMSPDGFIYVLTDARDGALFRLE